MPDKLNPATRWATRVHTDATASLARDLKALSINVAQCRACKSRWFALSCRLDAFNRFMAPRLFSALVIVVAAFTAMAVLT